MEMLKITETKLKKVLYGQSELKALQASCSICFEEFTNDTVVRETPCQHLFHNHCLMEWIKTKFTQPDCPYCRNDIINGVNNV